MRHFTYNTILEAWSHSARKVSHDDRKEAHGARKVSHEARKVSHDARKVSHDARKVSMGARKVSHVVRVGARQQFSLSNIGWVAQNLWCNFMLDIEFCYLLSFFVCTFFHVHFVDRV